MAEAKTFDAFGHEVQLTKKFGLISLLGLGYAIINTWTALSSSLSLVLPSGGQVAVIWGLLVSGLGSAAVGLSLSEICIVYPSSSGQVDWTAALAPPGWARSLSYMVGWILNGAWWALSASGGSLMAGLVLGLFALMDEHYESKSWHTFVVFAITTVLALLINVLFNRHLSLLNTIALYWSLAGFGIICVVLLAVASPNFQTGHFVFQEFTNQTGWPNGVAFILGLLQSCFSLTAFDSVVHLLDEGLAARDVPKAMMFAIIVGTVTGFIFAICILFVITDIDSVNNAATGPIVEIFYQGLQNKAGAVCLTIFPMVCVLNATYCIMTTSSRMCYSFSREKGLPFSSFWARVNVKLDLPLHALMLCFVLCIIFGLIYLGTSTAFNAIISSSVIAFNLSYLVPILLLVLTRRRGLGTGERSFNLGKWGFPINLFALAFLIVTTIFFIFPPAVPVTSGSEMNYAIVVIAIVALFAIVYWFAGGRKWYEEPRLLKSAEAVPFTPIVSETPGSEKR